ncbi:MAG: hypothetical protein DRR19_23005, partial [Candidatus Parabeggiatoa sp. nov. 1]
WFGCNSFTADTLVHTENGLKPISEIKVGDKVLSYDERTETTRYQPVMAVIQGEQRYQLISITLDSGESLEATAEHPFYIKGKGWNPASSLKVGQALQLHNGTTVVIKQIDTSVRLEKVYNLTVANTHNYFVGEDGVLVHNCPPKSGKRRKNRIPDKGKPNTVAENPAGTTRKKYGPDGNVQKEWNKGHGSNAPKNEQNDHIHDYKPNPHNPSGKGERMPGRKPRQRDLYDMGF